jgi:hypothetical protein
MTLIVTPGAADADSYATLAAAVAYAEARGLAFPGDNEEASEQALRRATSWIDATYRARFMGQRRYWRKQALEWPRYGVVDASGYPIAFDVIPVEIVRATIEAAVREYAAPNSLTPDFDRGGLIKSVSAGSVAVTFADGAGLSGSSFARVLESFDAILGPLLGAQSLYTARAVRG